MKNCKEKFLMHSVKSNLFCANYQQMQTVWIS